MWTNRIHRQVSDAAPVILAAPNNAMEVSLLDVYGSGIHLLNGGSTSEVDGAYRIILKLLYLHPDTKLALNRQTDAPRIS
jgi:hypothetical protein